MEWFLTWLLVAASGLVAVLTGYRVYRRFAGVTLGATLGATR